MLKLTDITELEKVSILDALFWVDRDRSRLIPVVRGGDGPDGDAGSGDGGDGSDGGNGDGGDPPKTFTQAEVDRLMGRTRAEAAKTAKTEIEAFLAAQKSETDKATMDEAARAKAEADEARAEGERLKAEGARERFEAKVERKLGTAGVPDTAIARAVRLIDLDVDADDDTITAEIDQLRKDVPGLFAAAGEEDDKGKPKPASGVTAGNAPKGGQAAKTAIERGAELYRAKKKPATAA